MSFLSHLDTIIPAKLARKPTVSLTSEVWSTPDNDRIAVDHSSTQLSGKRLVLFHGLEGGSSSHYAKYIVAKFQKAGWAVTLPHFRTCGELANLQPRAYHAGDYEEIGWIIQQVANQFRPTELYVAGVSLGGNALLHWLGKAPHLAHQLVKGAAAISAPMNLLKAGNALNIGWNKKLYGNYFLYSLKPKALAIIRQHPALSSQLNVGKIENATTIGEFDEYFTAPLHGFKSVDDYWEKASSLPLLKQISVPTLLLNALNDPFIPADSLPSSNDVSSLVTRQFPARGGHVGFQKGCFLAKQNNALPDIVLNYFHSLPN